jgi:DNA-directed RNA polymerase specialized sigma24 family protein
MDKIEQIVNSIHWYDRTLFNYHYKMGYKLREISEMTGINLKSIAYTIKKTRDKIKKELNDDRNLN